MRIYKIATKAQWKEAEATGVFVRVPESTAAAWRERYARADSPSG